MGQISPKQSTRNVVAANKPAAVLRLGDECYAHARRAVVGAAPPAALRCPSMRGALSSADGRRAIRQSSVTRHAAVALQSACHHRTKRHTSGYQHSPCDDERRSVLARWHLPLLHGRLGEIGRPWGHVLGMPNTLRRATPGAALAVLRLTAANFTGPGRMTATAASHNQLLMRRTIKPACRFTARASPTVISDRRAFH